MENNKQSSVEWLAEIIRFANKELYAEMFEEIDQAKAMHKEELLNIFNCGRNFQATGEGTFNEIYNEIYGS